MDRLLTVADLAERLSIAPGSLYRWVAQGRLTCIRFSARCIRFRESDVAALLEKLSDVRNRASPRFTQGQSRPDDR